MIKLYWCPQSRAIRALWLLEEAGIPYERVKIDIRDPKSQSDANFRAVSPLGKVPAIEDGPVRIADSGAICIYIADAYPQANLGPRIGDPKRGEFLQWTVFNNSNIEPSMVEKFMKLPPNPSTYGWRDYASTLDVLRKGVENAKPWILGERFSAADVMLGSAVNSLFKFGMLDLQKEPVLKAYDEQCMARPAAQRAAQISNGQAS